MHGWIILDKPLGLGSTQAVSAVKRALRQSGAGKWKVGHGGTLDPLATGVLPIAVGEATKLAGRMLDSDKIYDFTIGFGLQTDTLDLEGREIATSLHRPTLAEVQAVLPRFTGPIEQAPPAYSAILIDGRRAYDLARKGEEVEMKTRAITIHNLAISPPQGPAKPGEGEGGAEIGEITLRAHVSKGTYIRSLARDIARALGTVGHVTMLRRIKAGPFTLQSAISLDKLDEAARGGDIAQLMLPLTAGLDDIPALAVSPDDALALRQGKVLVGKPHTGLMLAMEGETPVALVEASGPEVRVVRGFNL
ncbi:MULTISPECIES: tRNA pseudouridine(55) synthase TruB [Sphingobium]|uniref:tRNA pseudouridine synthase B n=1 Tax=Sphingobium fuliginis (strain ATCC 27551) TaxID=336203 RepID=A0A292ZG50_SPHSA|nr:MULTISPECIES: tRNA pseudouridine(55) synthase TruB [Sphingobium]AJR24997.1 pseudouridine synthase [Sphingobium sp. YBL2]PNP99476.1 tRNA pseudouridine(55) synthase TruB [Sphingobium sp. SA916]RYL97687.1 tRNA pseudouridine(55) synthase TruB [Sphingobium fuliginis]UXC91369.1 tRNA pseudouridine(55) synthase TruB [Sphingobium sp. RSMS]WDA37203.1 tRNA pseudouridine(55) synthase TruB [Sphingobium sp. YC-XJ3]